MNLLLLEPEDCPEPGVARLSGRRLQHVLEVHRAAVGESLRVGMQGGLMGTALISALTPDLLELHYSLTDPPPAKLPLTLVLALPRPKMLKRVLQTVAAMGVARLVLLHSYRVEKSFWGTPWLEPAALREQLVLGLEQARDTVLPEVIVERRFKPFVEDRLPVLIAGKLLLLAHPVTATACPIALQESATLVIGPEGGFIPYEVDLLVAQGFSAVHLGPRILRVENAVPALLARLYP